MKTIKIKSLKSEALNPLPFAFFIANKMYVEAHVTFKYHAAYIHVYYDSTPAE